VDLLPSRNRLARIRGLGCQNAMTFSPFCGPCPGPGEGICHLINLEEGRH
jgi:hypothetical protein